jgi:MFS family permease
MFIAGTAGFALASSLGGIAPNAAVLIVARILQGAAGALLTTGSLSLLRSTFGTQSGRAIGIWATGTGAVSLGGPPLGGALVEWASWRWIFFLNVPLAVGAISLAWVAHREITRREAPHSKLDVLGAGLVALGIGSLTYGLVQGGEHGFADVAWAFLLAGASFGAFLVRERRTRDPLLPLSLFRSRDFTARQRCHLPQLQCRRRLGLLPCSLPAVGRRLYPLSDGSPSSALDRRHASPCC